MNQLLDITIEWFGATTFRLKANGLVIFLDTWLDRPSILPSYLPIDDVNIADYILISHAHFDHLPGADRLAKRTGATVIGNCEAINILRRADVPDRQLVAVAGGEKIALFTKEILKQARDGKISCREAPPNAPALPHPSHAVMSVDVWPSLHCLMPPGSHADIPDIMDTGTVYNGAAHPYVCTFDLNYGMKHGLLEIDRLVSPESRDPGLCSFIEYIKDSRNLFSAHDGGQLMFNIHVTTQKTILWNAHLGAYEGIMRALKPKPSVAILGIAGRANADGSPFNGSAAQYAMNEVKWLAEPKQVIWCLHDESPIPPYRIATEAATEMVENTNSRVLVLKHATVTRLSLE